VVSPSVHCATVLGDSPLALPPPGNRLRRARPIATAMTSAPMAMAKRIPEVIEFWSLAPRDPRHACARAACLFSVV